MKTRFKFKPIMKPTMIGISFIVLFLSSCKIVHPDQFPDDHNDHTDDDIETELKAFPSAYGAGAIATGGRGGDVIHVTNLNNSGAGSLRAALMMTVPRTIVFDVSGRIHLTSLIELIEENSNFTVAGQTAPEGGITISGRPIQMGGGYNRANQPCNNAIWRYIRFRNGSYTGVPDVYMHNGFLSAGTDGLILDHCSFSFNDDQGLSMNAKSGDIKNVTVQRSIFSNNATGVIAGVMDSERYPYDTGNMTFINNLFVDQSHRTPNMSGNLPFEVINNVCFNWISRLSNLSNNNIATINYIGNYLKPGDNTFVGSANKIADDSSFNGMIYSAQNYHSTLYPIPQLDDQGLWQTFLTDLPVDSSVFTTTQHHLLDESYNIKSATDTFTDVLSDVGTNRFMNADGTYGVYLDSYDAMKIANVENNISSDPYDKTYVLPILPTNTRPAGYDTDNDGMPDVWEIVKFGDLSKDGTGDTDGDGYTDLEEFLNRVDM